VTLGRLNPDSCMPSVPLFQMATVERGCIIQRWNAGSRQSLSIVIECPYDAYGHLSLTGQFTFETEHLYARRFFSSGARKTAKGAQSIMIRSTFVHLPNIGIKTELALWRSGIRDWSELRSTPLGSRQHVAFAIDQSEDALHQGNAAFFFERLPPSERWRVLTEFGHQFVSVDIETTGLSIYDKLTVVGVEGNGAFQAFIDGLNMDGLHKAFDNAAGVITFNGSLFDLPFLRRTFPDLEIPYAHIDLRFLGRRVELRGSFDKVERAAGLERETDVRSVGGYEATVLWSQFLQGDDAALELLIRYNAADTCNLRPLSQIIVRKLQKRLLAFIRGSESQYLPGLEPSKPLFVIGGSDHLDTPIAPRVTRDKGWMTVGDLCLSIPNREPPARRVNLQTLLSRFDRRESRVVGIDLTGSENRPSGWALLESDLVVTGMLGSNEEIVRRTIQAKPSVVSIDSPLSLPAGRDCTRDDCNCRKYGITREAERELRRRGIHVYPCLIPSMQKLTQRGMQLASTFRAAGIEVIECYPGAAQDLMGIPRKKASLEQLRSGLIEFGVRGIRPLPAVKHDELDAVTAAVVGAFYLSGLVESLGSAEENFLIVPLSAAELPPALEPIGDENSNLEPVLFIVQGAPLDSASSFSREYLPTFVDTSEDVSAFWERGASVGMVATEGAAFEGLFQQFGPRVRRAILGDERPRRADPGRVFTDIVLNRQDADWERQLGNWIASFDTRGVEACL
jgi:predicted nuclease with RNAse H fold/uncharacterized protein YprB with RNaseH-like and TPR domain